MANQQAFQAYSQNKGTLVPGQSISVNRYTVQVERYLSQGGFAHVYLVRTATPVYNTTHHVLKRIAVPNEAMLTDVKKEVDIMRLLKGHPNIVHLIDAAWHKMSDGLYEVFILMEFCAGGGIIDMMNRRLRERLTEAEILQIFVDVCEGVAFMHNSRPPLLHRDLKVENILQSSPTSYKLCDFGSATTVAARPPATTQEIRALEADLNRHTTLQYRAPEMVDPFLRRPVDEKSDVWALGVLLYKLCYYTTPFEEHGPLAILNVQYRIPPYPVYSTQMNSLIASMLREHGAQRPSVFELLSHVHRLRGTKSQFHYTIPVPQPLSPRHQTQSQSSTKAFSANSLDNSISYRSAHQVSSNSRSPAPKVETSPDKNAGVQAREKVLEAIAPMRRGRPVLSNEAQPPKAYTPRKELQGQAPQPKPTDEGDKNWLDNGFEAAEEKAWKSVAPKSESKGAKIGFDDAWKVGNRDHGKEAGKSPGFGDDFAEKLWDSFDPNADTKANVSAPSSIPVKATITPRPPAFTGNDVIRPKVPVILRGKDAFEGLGIASSDRPAPTLGEARKLRTGLAVMSPSANGTSRYDTRNSDASVTSAIPRPTPSPRPSYLAQTQPQYLSPFIPSSSPGSSWKPEGSSSRPSSSQGQTAESRFPSLEELDATFGKDEPIHRSSGGSSDKLSSRATNHLPLRSSVGNSATGSVASSRPVAQPQGSYLHALGNDGSRSQQVTGTAMRDPRGGGRSGDGTASRRGDRQREQERNAAREAESSSTSKASESQPLASRPTLVRKHRSSMSVKQTPRPEQGASSSDAWSYASELAALSGPASNETPRSALPVPGDGPRDWLTGDEDPSYSTPSSRSAETPVLRDSPSKRASYIERSPILIPQATVAQQEHAPSLRPPSPAAMSIATSTSSASNPLSVSRAARVFPAVSVDTNVADPSPASALTDNWSPVETTDRPSSRRRETESSSSADDGPEDVNGRMSRPTAPPQENKQHRRKGRQSSVHDLVDLWGGGLSGGPKESEKAPIRGIVASNDSSLMRRSTIVPSSSSRAAPRTLSPQPISSTPTNSIPTEPYSKRVTPNIGNHRKQPSGSGFVPSKSERSRPQSMFVFPSSAAGKPKNDGVGLPSPSLSSAGLSSASGLSSGLSSGGLAPPEDPKPRAIRRTSISDMVQRYEAIGGKPKTPGAQPPAVGPKPAVSTQNTETGRYPRARGISPSPSGFRGNTSDWRSTSPLPGDSANTYTELEEPRRSPTLIREYVGASRPSQINRQENERPKDSEAEPSRSSFADERLTSGAPRTTFPSRKPTTSQDDSSTADGRSPSPERPYQGVGKLIDQWQRKTADNDTSRNPAGNKRGGYVARRAGLVNTGANRGQ